MDLIKELEGLKEDQHYYCEDTWYSCPEHPEGCANEAAGDECDCGLHVRNARIDKIISYIRPTIGIIKWANKIIMP